MLPGMASTAAVELRKVSKTFGSRPPITAVDGLDVTIPRGGLTALVGANGAGKSTVLRLLAGTLSPDEGTIRIMGRDLFRHRDAVRQESGVLLGSTAGLYQRLTAREHLRYLGRLRGISGSRLEERIEELSELYGLGQFLDRRTGGFSTGMRQRTAIAAAVIHRPKLLILDEPSSGLDITVRREVVATIAATAAAGVTVLVATHYPQEFSRHMTRLWIMSRGRTVVFEKTTEETVAAQLAGGLQELL
jgi:sodium transport system ATP-binding protein